MATGKRSIEDEIIDEITAARFPGAARGSPRGEKLSRSQNAGGNHPLDIGSPRRLTRFRKGVGHEQLTPCPLPSNFVIGGLGVA